MSKKAIFDHNKAKAILKERDGTKITIAKTSKEFDYYQRTIEKMMIGRNSGVMCFLLEFCNKHKLTIQDVITIKDE